MGSEQYIRYEEALSELGISNDEMKRLIQQGEISAYRHKGKMMFKMSDVQKVRGGEGSSSAAAPTLVMGGGASSEGGADSLVFDDASAVSEAPAPKAPTKSATRQIQPPKEEVVEQSDDSSSQDLVFDFNDASSIDFMDSNDGSGSGAATDSGSEIPTIQFDAGGSDPLGGSSSDILPTADLNFDDVSHSETVNFDTQGSGDSSGVQATMSLDDASASVESGGFAPTIQMDQGMSTMSLDEGSDQTEALSLDGEKTDGSSMDAASGGIGPTIEESAPSDEPGQSHRGSMRSSRFVEVTEIEEAPIHVAWAVVAVLTFVIMAMVTVVAISFVTNRTNGMTQTLVETCTGATPSDATKMLPGASNQMDKKGKKLAN